MAIHFLQRVAFLFAILVGDAGLNDFPQPRSKASAILVWNEAVNVVPDGDHRLLDNIFRFFVGQTGRPSRRIDEIAVQFVEPTPTVLVSSTNLGEERRSCL